MKKLWFAGSVFAVCLAPPAMAADMAVKAPFYGTPVATAYNWTGCYGGGNAGYGWGSANDAIVMGGSWITTPEDLGNVGFLTPQGTGQLKPNGFTGGAQAGCNYQTSSQWVVGIEGDVNYFGLKDSFSRTGPNPNPVSLGSAYRFESSFQSDWLVTVRQRIGYAFDRLLVYATGGLAITNQRFSQAIIETDFPATETGSISKTMVGWTVGVGAEYALDNRWSLKTEYLYVDPGSVSFSTSASCPTQPIAAVSCTLYAATHSAHLKANIVRVGINYHF